MSFGKSLTVFNFIVYISLLGEGSSSQELHGSVITSYQLVSNDDPSSVTPEPSYIQISAP